MHILGYINGHTLLALLLALSISCIFSSLSGSSHVSNRRSNPPCSDEADKHYLPGQISGSALGANPAIRATSQEQRALSEIEMFVGGGKKKY